MKTLTKQLKTVVADPKTTICNQYLVQGKPELRCAVCPDGYFKLEPQSNVKNMERLFRFLHTQGGCNHKQVPVPDWAVI